MENQIKLGDIVTLKSDTSVLMTIGRYSEFGGRVICYYFVNLEIRQFEISPEALIKVS